MQIETRQPHARAGLPLPTRDRLDAGAHDLGDVGALEHRQTEQAGDEVGEQDAVRRTARRCTGVRPRRGVAGELVHAQQRHQLAAEEEVEDEDEYQRRHVAHELDIARATMRRNRLLEVRHNAHDQPDHCRNDRCPRARDARSSAAPQSADWRPSSPVVLVAVGDERSERRASSSGS